MKLIAVQTKQLSQLEAEVVERQRKLQDLTLRLKLMTQPLLQGWAEVRTLSPCKMLVVARRQFSKFLALVPDIRQRLERTKQLRKKQSELTVQYNEDGAVVRADRLRKLENDARRGSDLQHYSWAVEQHVPAFSTAAATRIQRRWRRTLSDRRDRRRAAAAARRAPPPPSLTHTQSARAAGEASPRRPVRPRRGSALRR